jgi:hypothetical protein
MSKKIPVYLEIGKKKTFAGAIDWPGWCRSGKDEASALQALLEYAPRYQKVLKPAGIDFAPPADGSQFEVIERLPGDATTDFGTPGKPPSRDEKVVGLIELQHLEEILKACWKALDAARRKAGDRQLRKGPRGGGRETEQIIRHAMGSEKGYLGALGWKWSGSEEDTSPASLKDLRKAVLEGLEASAAGKIEKRGPRGGLRWSPRYFVRREAWHVLDHAWEIEDRVVDGRDP